MLRTLFTNYTMINAPSNDEEIPKWIALREHVLDNYVALRVSCQWDDIQANNEHINTIIRWTGPDVKDNWQTPAETITKLSGDCMDIASYKYGQMRKSGFSDDQLGIVLCELTVGLMKNNPQHAFLIVEFNGVVKVLDSRFDHIIDPKDYINMIPLKFLYGPDVLLFAKQTTLSGEKVEPVA